MREILLYFSIKYQGNWQKIYNALENKEDVNYETVSKYAEQHVGKYITILDSNYPTKLKGIENPPFVIYYKGDLALLERTDVIWPLNSIEMDPKKMVKILEDLDNEKFTTVTAYASPLETETFECSNFRNLIVVKDSGIDSSLILTEKREEKLLDRNNLILSEYPGYVIPSKRNWEESNRIKIGLSNSVLLINSLKEKELFRIISETLQEGKEVYCIYNKGIIPNDHNDILIQKGAYGINEIMELKH